MRSKQPHRNDQERSHKQFFDSKFNESQSSSFWLTTNHTGLLVFSLHEPLQSECEIYDLHIIAQHIIALRDP